ncbi:MCE family protein [bacterium]|nr:MCE family protein [bacterium]
MKIAKEVKVGVLAIIAITMLIVGYNFLRGENLFTSTNHYYADFEKVDNLFKSNPVLLNGYKIGQVSNVEMDHATLKLTVEIAIPSDIPLPDDSKIKIINNDMIGSKAIEIVYGESESIAPDGSTLEGVKDANIIDEINKVVTPLSQSIAEILRDIDTAISGVTLKETVESTNQAIIAFRKTTDEINKVLEGKDKELDIIFGNVAAMSEDLKNLTPRINAIAEQLEQTSGDLAEIDFKATVERVNSLVTELNEVSASLNSTDNSMGKLMNEEDLYNNLNKTVQELESLISDIEANPCRYFALTSRQRRKCEEEIAKGEN